MNSHSLYSKKVLKNGLTVLLVPIETAASVTMTIFVKTGSRYETHSQNGISHFLEHLHFKGTKLYPNAKKLSEKVDSIGGEFNANTGKEHTQYYIRAAYEHFPLVFGVLTDMLQNPLLDGKEMEREKGVIIEEINMYRDNPQVQVESLFDDMMWPNQPLGRDIAGSPDVVRKLTRDDVVSYRNRFYQPSNMIIAIAGKFDSHQVEHMIDAQWGRLPAKKTAGFDPGIIKQKGPRVVLQNKATEQAQMVVGFKGYPYKHKNNNALRVLATILGGGMSSRLFLRIRERQALAYYVSASISNYLDSGSFTVQAGLKTAGADKALYLIMDELNKIKKNSIKSTELIKAKSYIKGKIALAMEDPHDKLEWYLGQEAFLGRIRTIKQAFAELDAVTVESVHKVAEEIIKPECVNVSVVGPFADKKIFERKLNV